MDREVTFEEAGTHQLEQELKEYKKFFDETPVAFLRIDIKTGIFLMANNYCATLLGYETVQELIQKERKNNLFTKDDRNVIIQKIKKEGSVEGYELVLHPKNGRTVWASAWLHINCGGTCLEGSLLDITSQKEMEYELDSLKSKQLNRMKGISDKLETMVSSYAL